MAGVPVWEALAGRAPGRPLGPADRDLYEAVLERLNPAKARPVFREGVEEAHLTSARGQPYVMLRSPGPEPAYVRLHPEEVALAHLMDGSRSVASLVAAFARATGRLAPSQVMRVVADLAANRMLTELPVDAFHSLDAVRRRPLPLRFGRWLLAVARGQRFSLLDVDHASGLLYRYGGRLFFTRAAGVLLVAAAVVGGGVFVVEWSRGAKQAFLVNGSYAAGGLTLLGLNVLCLAAHELGHALAAKHAGRRVPAAGILLYFGIPSVFVDTTDVWMAGRRARILTSAAGPGVSLAMAGAVNIAGLLVPGFGPLAFRLSFLWYLNALFNLNPLLALDGYYLLMDWLEIPNLRARGLVSFLGNLRRRRLGWRGLAGEDRLVAMYGTAAGLWVLISIFLAVRIWKDRVRGLVTGLWYGGWPSRIGLVAFVAVLVHPLVYLAIRRLGRSLVRARAWHRERRREADESRRLRTLAASALARLPAGALAALAREATWERPRSGSDVIRQGAAPDGVIVVVEGALEAHRAGDPPGSPRGRADAGELAGVNAVLRAIASPLTWRARDAVLLVVPAAAFISAVGEGRRRLGPEGAEAEAVLDLPAFASLTEADRAALLPEMRHRDLEPGQSFGSEGPDRASVVGTGVLRLASGDELRVGKLIGPFENEPGILAEARTPATVWSVPTVTGLPPMPDRLAGAGPPPGGGAGIHPDGDLAISAPWGPPPARDDGRHDDHLARRLRRLIVILLVLAVLTLKVASAPGAGWTEMADGRVLVSAAAGTVEVTAGRRSVTLREGASAAFGRGVLVSVPKRSLARLTFRGGAGGLLCPGSQAIVGVVNTLGPEPLEPVGGVTLRGGKIVLDTESPGDGFEPLKVRLRAGRHLVVNRGNARFAATRARVDVTAGAVSVDGVSVSPSARAASCGVGRGGIAPQRGGGVVPPTTPGLTSAPAAPSSTAATDGTLPTGTTQPPSTTVPSTSIPTSTSTWPASSSTTSSPASTTSSSSTSSSTSTSTSTSSSTSTPPAEPDFSISCAPSMVQTGPGQTLSSACKVTSVNGFAAPVTLSCSINQLVGACDLDQTLSPPADGSAGFVVVIRMRSSVPPGCYRATIRGESRQPQPRTTTIFLDVPGSRGASC